MKKLSVVVLVLVVMLVGMMAGCGGSKSNSDSDSSSDKSSDKKLKIALSMSERDQFLSSMEKAASDKADELGVDLTVQDAQKDVQRQLDQVKSFVSQGFDAIIVNIVEVDTAESIIDAAGDIPVVFVNRQPAEDLLVEGKDVTVVSDEFEGGKLQAEYIAELFKDKDPKTLDAAILLGIIGHPGTIGRTDGVKAGLEEAGFTLNVQFEDTAEFDRAKAMQLIQQFLGTNKHIDVIVANNDEMALGAIEALKAVGKTTADIPVIGFDGTSEGIRSVKEGEMTATILQNAVEQGAHSVTAAIGLANGDDVEKIDLIPFDVITKANVADFE
ncbi:MAG: substrate-binding domain-containing protein [Clostridiales Family XIII bacterium]|nr:substrate-binding domain-containing protein [Clostridiales Family XIII bacterium]